MNKNNLQNIDTALLVFFEFFGLDPAIIDELMKGYQRPAHMTGPGEILKQLTKRVYELILEAEMTHYLGYEKGQAPQSEEDKKG